MRWQERWVDRFYRSRPGWRDGTVEFHDICRAHVVAGAKILEVGAGPTNQTSRFLASLGELHGVDVSEEVLGNVHLKTSALIRDKRYPYADASFEVAISDYVVEHVDDAEAHLREIHRVLTPGGRYIFRTPNLFHYVALVSRFTWHGFHKLVANPLRAVPSGHHDPWPTVYIMNTPAAVRRYASRARFDIERLDLVEKEPSYGMYARPLFLAFMGYERAVNATRLLAPLRANLFVVLRRSEA
jgi:SAM-dependent methyltransferase